MVLGPKKPSYVTYCKNRDIRIRLPKIKDYLDPHWSDQDSETYLNECRHQAHIWLNNQLEAFELETYALDNDKRGIEADYAIFLVLRGAAKRAPEDILVRFKTDAEEAVKVIHARKTSRKNLNSQVSRMTRNRTKLKDFGHLGD